MSLVVNLTCTVPKGQPSSAAAATPDSHETRGRVCALAQLTSMKLPAAPESINARESNCELSNIMVTGTSSVDKVDGLELTKDEPLEVGLVGQEILKWPGRPQYRHRFSRHLRSLSHVRSSQVTFIYIALLTIQIVTKHCTISK